MGLRGSSRFLSLIFVCVFPLGCSFSFIERAGDFPSGSTSGDFPDFDHYGQVNPTIAKRPTQLAQELLEFLNKVFLLKNSQDMKCGNGQTFQKFVNMYFVSPEGKSPVIRYICLSKFSEGDQQLEWILSDIEGATWTLVPPQNLFNLDFSAVKTLNISADTTFRFTIKTDRVVLDWDGVTVNLSSKILAGTAFSWIPESLLTFSLDSVEARNDGVFVCTLRLPLSIPYTYTGGFEVVASKNQVIRFKQQNGKVSN